MASNLPSVLCCQLFRFPESLFLVTIPEVCSICFPQNLAESLCHSLMAIVWANALVGIAYWEDISTGKYLWSNMLTLLMTKLKIDLMPKKFPLTMVILTKSGWWKEDFFFPFHSFDFFYSSPFFQFNCVESSKPQIDFPCTGLSPHEDFEI